MNQWQALSLPQERPDEDMPALLAWRKMRSPQLQNYRDVLVALPPSYREGQQRYPVVYMHDGQNLFDPATSYAGDWNLLATLAELAEEGVEAIVVGIANTGSFRRYEYSPFHDPAHGGGDGDRYLAFIADTLRPQVDQDFRTLTGPDATVVAGSSMGGLISLYALYRRPDLFGSAAAFSPSAWFAEDALIRLASAEPPPAGRLYLDAGTAESPVLVGSVRRLRDALVEAGLAEGERFRYVEDEGADHHETHWGRRVRDALPFLLGSDRSDGSDALPGTAVLSDSSDRSDPSDRPRSYTP